MTAIPNLVWVDKQAKTPTHSLPSSWRAANNGEFSDDLARQAALQYGCRQVAPRAAGDGGGVGGGVEALPPSRERLRIPPRMCLRLPPRLRLPLRMRLLLGGGACGRTTHRSRRRHSWRDGMRPTA
jgi:hypothetical protein